MIENKKTIRLNRRFRRQKDVEITYEIFQYSEDKLIVRLNFTAGCPLSRNH